jgi:hypothetical protein
LGHKREGKVVSMNPLRSITRHVGVLAILMAALACAAALPAQARVHVGIGFGFPLFPPPVYYPPPAYYPPPVYYPPPPPVYYVPPAPPITYAPPTNYTPSFAPPGPSAGGQSCFAGHYTCPMERPIPTGAACYCPGNRGERVPGRTN